MPMTKVKRSTPVTACAPLDPGATAAMAKKLAPAGAAITPGKSPAAPAAIVIEITSSPERSTGGSQSMKKGRKRPAPRLLDLDDDDEIEMWTPQQRQRLEDDCQILAGDPFSSITEVTPSPAAANDEIAVVGERGKIACRDYPHARAACAKHPFSTTPHEQYCDKCFCYVCDVAAPCVLWKGHGGHCHASDRESKWKSMRSMRKSTKAKPS